MTPEEFLKSLDQCEAVKDNVKEGHVVIPARMFYELLRRDLCMAMLEKAYWTQDSLSLGLAARLIFGDSEVKANA